MIHSLVDLGVIGETDREIDPERAATVCAEMRKLIEDYLALSGSEPEITIAPLEVPAPWVAAGQMQSVRG